MVMKKIPNTCLKTSSHPVISGALTAEGQAGHPRGSTRLQRPLILQAPGRRNPREGRPGGGSLGNGVPRRKPCKPGAHVPLAVKLSLSVLVSLVSSALELQPALFWLFLELLQRSVVVQRPRACSEAGRLAIPIWPLE